MFRVYMCSYVFTQKARSIYGSGLLWVLESLVEPTALNAPAKFTLEKVADEVPGPLILWPVAFKRLAGFRIVNQPALWHAIG